MFSFEKLEVWQRARKFLKEIYKVTALFPQEEQFGLSQHIRRSAISVFSNIAEATNTNAKNSFTSSLRLHLTRHCERSEAISKYWDCFGLSPSQ